MTIRKALDILVREGMVERKRGVGTSVFWRESKVWSFEFRGSAPVFLSSVTKLKLEVDVLEITVTTCPTWVRQILSPNSEEEVWQMKRIRRYKKMPVAFYTHYSLIDSCKEVTKELATKMSFIDLLSKICGIKLIKWEERLEATTADLDLSTILDVDFGKPLFLVNNIYYSENEQPVAITQAYYRGDRIFYRAVVQS